MASNLQAAQSGDRREALVALRDTLATMLDQTEAQIHAQLAAQYRATLTEIAEIDRVAAEAEAEETKQHVDEVGRRRAFNAAAI